MKKEIILKAKAAGSPEELMKIARENGLGDFSEDNAREYFEVIQKTGELSDEEIENASGGGCTKNGRKIVTRGNICNEIIGIHCGNWDGWDIMGWLCNKCLQDAHNCHCGRHELGDLEREFGVSFDFGSLDVCGSCRFCTYEGGTWYCNRKINGKTNYNLP